MQQAYQALLSCGLFLLAGAAGLFLRGFLPERHRDRDTIDFIRLAIGALVTFLAIVLGLVTAASVSHFDEVANSYRHLAAELVLVDNDLRELGPIAAPVHAELRSYLAAVIFSTWPNEPAPSGAFPRGLVRGQRESTPLSALLDRVQEQLRVLQPQTRMQDQLISATRRQFGSLIDARWVVIETAHPTIPEPFYDLMLFWTALMFLGLGLCAPRNAVVAVTMLICAISLASVIYVILELDDPVGGSIAISSAPLRDALVDLDQPMS